MTLGTKDGQRQPQNKLQLYLAAFCVLVALAIAIEAFLLLHGASPFSADIQKQVSFSLYYPASTPATPNAVDKANISYDAASGVVFMPITINKHHVVASQQAMSNKLTFGSLRGQGTVIENPNGQSAISSAEGRMVAVMISSDNKTLLLLNSSDATKEEMTSLLKSFQKVQ